MRYSLALSSFCALALLLLATPGLLAAGNVYPLAAGYYSPAGIDSTLWAICNRYPNQTNLQIAGTTATLHLPVYALRIANKKAQSTIPVLLVGQHQSEEPLGINIVFAWAKYVLQSNPQLLNKFSFYIVPTLNPEGYQQFYQGDRLKRKNCSDTNFNGIAQQRDGVDLNKNYPVNWEYDPPTGPHNAYHKGPWAFSEPEPAALAALGNSIRFELAVFYHSSLSGNYNETIFFSYNHGGLKPADWDTMHYLAQCLADYLPCDYKPGNYTVHTGNTSKQGFARDYFYQTFGTYPFTVEVGGVNQQGVPVVFPGVKQRNKIVAANLAALVNMLTSYSQNIGRNHLTPVAPKAPRAAQPWGGPLLFLGDNFQKLPYGNASGKYYLDNQPIVTKIDSALMPWLSLKQSGTISFYPVNKLGQLTALPANTRYLWVNKPQQTISFANTVVTTNPYVLHPGASCGLKTNIVQRGGNYGLAGVNVHARPLGNTAQTSLSLCVESPNSTNSPTLPLTFNKKKNVFDSALDFNLSCPAIRITVTNTGSAPVLIYRGSSGDYTSGANIAGLVTLKAEAEADFAIEMRIRKY